MDSWASARIALFEPKPHPLTPAEERWGPHQTDDSDSLGLIHGLRYYIYGLRIIGLLLVVEDYAAELSRRRKAATPKDPINPQP